jgi:hypothetical protein
LTSKAVSSVSRTAAGQLLFFKRLLALCRAHHSRFSAVPFFSRSHDAVIRVYDEAGNVTGTQEQVGEFKEP